ncbi:MAG: NUDIX hydrolase [Arenibacterium sp.]
MRRFGEPPLREKTYTRRPGAYAILPMGKKLLLTHQSDPDPEFQLPGGGIDPGESPLQALHREVLEETGWRISDARRLGVFKRYVFMPEYDLWAEKICNIYLAFPTYRVSQPTEEMHSVHFIDPTEALDLLENPGDISFLRRVLS